MSGKRMNSHERRAIVALMGHTALNDREIAGLVGRGHWTIFHVRKAAGIPATNKGRCASGVSVGVQPPDAPPPTDAQEYWLQRDPSLDPYAKRRSA